MHPHFPVSRTHPTLPPKPRPGRCPRIIGMTTNVALLVHVFYKRWSEVKSLPARRRGYTNLLPAVNDEHMRGRTTGSYTNYSWATTRRKLGGRSESIENPSPSLTGACGTLMHTLYIMFQISALYHTHPNLAPLPPLSCLLPCKFFLYVYVCEHVCKFYIHQWALMTLVGML